MILGRFRKAFNASRKKPRLIHVKEINRLHKSGFFQIPLVCQPTSRTELATNRPIEVKATIHGLRTNTSAMKNAIYNTIDLFPNKHYNLLNNIVIFKIAQASNH